MQTRFGRAPLANLAVCSKVIPGTPTTVLHIGLHMVHALFPLRQVNARPEWASADGLIPIRGLRHAGAADTRAASATELPASAARRAFQGTSLRGLVSRVQASNGAGSHGGALGG